LVTDWPEATPGLHASAVRFAQTIVKLKFGLLANVAFVIGYAFLPA
jgi:hypothetical protein